MQKFKKRTRVWIADDLGSSMNHFTKGAWGYVEYTYAERFGGDGRQERIYSIDIDDYGSCAWYKESQLSLEKPLDRDRLASIIAREERKFENTFYDVLGRFFFMIQSQIHKEEQERRSNENSISSSTT